MPSMSLRFVSANDGPQLKIIQQYFKPTSLLKPFHVRYDNRITGFPQSLFIVMNVRKLSRPSSILGGRSSPPPEAPVHANLYRSVHATTTNSRGFDLQHDCGGCGCEITADLQNLFSLPGFQALPDFIFSVATRVLKPDERKERPVSLH